MIYPIEIAIPKGTVSELVFKIYLEIKNTIIAIGAPKQLVAKKKSSNFASGIPIRRATINFISPAPITPISVNKKPKNKVNPGINKLKLPKQNAIPVEKININKTHLFFISLFKKSVIDA